MISVTFTQAVDAELFGRLLYGAPKFIYIEGFIGKLNLWGYPIYYA